MTTDLESVARHHHIEFLEDLDLVVLEPTRKPPPPVRRPVRYDLIRWGRSLGPTAESPPKVQPCQANSPI
jgi:hypothetical protein